METVTLSLEDARTHTVELRMERMAEAEAVTGRTEIVKEDRDAQGFFASGHRVK